MGEWILFGISALLLVTGLFLMLSAVIGQYRFHYVLNRMHAASMGDSLGLLMILAGLSISAPDVWVIFKFALTAFFLWITSPTGSHLIARLEMTLNEHPENEMEVVEK